MTEGFVGLSHHVDAHPDGHQHQHGVSIQISINLGKKIIRISCLKGLGHAILGNFTTDQMVIEY